jgi:hypothetical protein
MVWKYAEARKGYSLWLRMLGLEDGEDTLFRNVVKFTSWYKKDLRFYVESWSTKRIL